MVERARAASFNIAFDQPLIHAGCQVTGKVYLSVNQDEVECVSISGKLVGLESASVDYIDTGSHHQKMIRSARDGWRFVDTTFRIRDVPGAVIGFGQYEFPFVFTMPTSVPASIYSGNKQCSGFTNYTVEVWLDRPGSAHRDFIHQETITVTPAAVRGGNPVLMQPQSLDIRSLSLFNRGSVLLGWRTEESALYAGEITGVKFAALNFSGVPVEAFEIKLTQYATFAVQEQIRVNKRRLFHTRILSEEAGFRSGFTPTGSDPLAATRHLYEALTAPDATGTAPVWTVRVTVPDDGGELVPRPAVPNTPRTEGEGCDHAGLEQCAVDPTDLRREPRRCARPGYAAQMQPSAPCHPRFVECPAPSM
jgi:hypothetical protein